MQNYEQLDEAFETLSASSGSAMKEQEAYMDSLSGKLNALKESLTGISIDTVNTSFVKGLVDGATTAVTSLRSMINTFGALPTAVTLASTAMSIFNKNFRTSVSAITGGLPVIGKWSASLTQTQAQLKKTIEGLKQEITTKKAYIVSQQEMGKSTTVATRELVGLQSQLAQTTTKLALATVKTIALQTVLSMGLGLAISGVMFVLNGFVSMLNGTARNLDETNEKAKELSETLGSMKTEKDLSSQYVRLNRTLEDGNISEEKKLEIAQRVNEIKEDLIGIDDRYRSVLENTTLEYQEQLALLEHISDERAKDQGEELDKSMKNGFWGKDESRYAKDALDELNRAKTIYEEIKRLQATADGGDIYSNLFGTLNAEDQAEQLKLLEELIIDSYETIQGYNDNVNKITESGADTTRKIVDLDDDIIDFTKSVLASTEALDANTRAKNANGNIDLGRAGIEGYTDALEVLQKALDGASIMAEASANVMDEFNESVDNGTEPAVALAEALERLGNVSGLENVTKTYGACIQEVGELYDMLETLNEAQGLTPELVQQVIDKYPEVGARVTDATLLQQFLNDKITEASARQAEAYEIMIGDDQNYYQQKIANNEQFQQLMNDSINAIVGMQNSGYQIDLANFTSLNDLKNGIQNQFGGATADFMNGVLGIFNAGYSIDSQNFANLNAMKQGYMNAIIPAIANWITQFTGGNADGYTKDLSNFNDLSQMKVYVMQQLEAKMVQLQNSWNSIIASYNDAVSQAYANGNENKAMEIESRALRKVSPIRAQINKISSAIGAVDKVFSGLQAQLDSYTASFNGGTFGGNVGNFGSGGGSGGSGGGSGSKDTEKEVEDLEDLTNKYYELQDVLEDVNNLLDINSTKQKDAHGAELQQLLRDEIGLLTRKKEILGELIKQYEADKNQLKASLMNVGVEFDGNDNITNYNELLEKQRAWANSLSGEDKEKAIEGVQAIQEAMEQFLKLANDEIPNMKEEWEDMVSSINNKSEDMLENVRDKLAKAIKQAREEEKQQKLDQLDDRIKKLKEEIKSLEDEDEDKQKKLLKLQAEYEKWSKDDSVKNNAPYVQKCA